MFEQTPDPALKAFTRAVAGMAPHPGGLDRDRLLFQAGQADQARRMRPWPWVSAALAVLAASLGGLEFFRQPEVRERVVLVRQPTPAPAPAPPNSDRPESAPLARAEKGGETASPEWREALSSRQQALRHGVDSLPQPQPWCARGSVPLEKVWGTPAEEPEPSPFTFWPGFQPGEMNP